MSGLLPKADIRRRIEHVCFVPIAVIVLVAAVLLVPFFFAMKGPFEERKDTILSKVKNK